MKLRVQRALRSRQRRMCEWAHEVKARWNGIDETSRLFVSSAFACIANLALLLLGTGLVFAFEKGHSILILAFVTSIVGQSRFQKWLLKELKVQNPKAFVTAPLDLLSRLFSTSDALSNSAHRLKSTSSTFGRGVDDQLQAVQKSLRIMSEFSSILEANTTFAKSSVEATASVTRMASGGNEIVEKSHASMREIELVHLKLEEIAEVIHGVKSKTDLIEEIMREAKILAFNAMIESSRAGEQGKGFMIVAQSLQNLAAACSEASQQIKGLANHGSEKSENIIKDVKATLTETKSINDQVVNKFSEISRGVIQISTMLDKIDESAKRQEFMIIECSESMAEVYAATASNRKVSDDAGVCGRFLEESGEEVQKISASLNEAFVTKNTAQAA